MGSTSNALLYNDSSASLIENAIGGSGTDILIGNRVANTLTGNNGEDTIYGAGGNDTLNGGAGDDSLFGDIGPIALTTGVGSGSGLVTTTPGTSIATALSLTSTFNFVNNVNIYDSTTNAHTTARYTTPGAGAVTASYYAINLNAGTTISLDIDATTGGLDTWIRLYNSAGTVIAENDDSSGDPGSSSIRDSETAFTIGATGVYYISVGRYSGGVYGNTLPNNVFYDLNISVAPPARLGADGVAGVDTAVYTVARSASTITRNTNGTVTINAGADGTDALTNMEWAQFADVKAWVGAQRNDSNNDGRSDILWRNNDGTPAIWQMNDGLFSAGNTLTNPGPGWTLVGSGDFNRDRKADLLWRETATGRIAEWQMDGTTIGPAQFLADPGPGTAWRPIAIADFNADGASDIALQHTNGDVAIWNMDGFNVLPDSAVLSLHPGPTWHLAAAADFDADSTADLLFQNDNGAVAIWRMNGSSFVSGVQLAENPTAAWHIVGTGDFNKDGKADIVWQHTNGDVAVWAMQGSTAVNLNPAFTNLVASPGANWSVGGVGDYNGDNVSDILLQDSNTGQVAVWTMNGNNLTPSGAILAQNPGTPWHMVG